MNLSSLIFSVPNGHFQAIYILLSIVLLFTATVTIITVISACVVNTEFTLLVEGAFFGVVFDRSCFVDLCLGVVVTWWRVPSMWYAHKCTLRAVNNWVPELLDLEMSPRGFNTNIGPPNRCPGIVSTLQSVLVLCMCMLRVYSTDGGGNSLDRPTQAYRYLIISRRFAPGLRSLLWWQWKNSSSSQTRFNLSSSLSMSACLFVRASVGAGVEAWTNTDRVMCIGTEA